MSDRVILAGMRFEGRHGVSAEERAAPQPFEVDVEMAMNLQPAGLEDDLERTADYGRAHQICRELVETTSFHLLEAIAEGIAHELLAAFPRIDQVTVRVRKMRPPMGKLAYAGVEVRRGRPGPGRGRGEPG